MAKAKAKAEETEAAAWRPRKAQNRKKRFSLKMIIIAVAALAVFGGGGGGAYFMFGGKHEANPAAPDRQAGGVRRSAGSPGQPLQFGRRPHAISQSEDDAGSSRSGS